MRCTMAAAGVLILLAVCVPTPLAQAPNAAIPQLDSHLPAYFKPRALASLFGTNLADSPVSTGPPWQQTLGGVEVHLVALATPCATTNLRCELAAGLLYVSPTQINFLVPDVSPAAYGQAALFVDVVLVRDGVRFDTKVNFYVSTGGDFAVFQVGFDCQFSLSLIHPEACGYAAAPGPNRVLIGAITDVAGNLITSQNPIRQGQVIILWATGLGALTTDPATGLMQQSNPQKITFGVIQLNTNNWAQTSIWAGESPQYVGLDQVSVAFPTCTGTAAAAEKRYDAYIEFSSAVADKNLGIGFATIYLPFLIEAGDPDCQPLNTATALSSSPNPSGAGQPVTFTATVSPLTLVGTVLFLEGVNKIGSAALGGGQATFQTSSLTAGTHSITAIYVGNTNVIGSVSGVLTQTVNKSQTTITLTSSPNPSISGQSVTFTAIVSPTSATGVVSFGLCTGILSGGQAQCSAIPAGPPGVQSIAATYAGDNDYSGSTSVPLMQTIKQPTSTSLTSSANPATLGQSVTFTALMYFSNATGTITFLDGIATLGSGPVTKAVATFSTSTLSAGSHSVTAVYSGDGSFGGSTSAVLIQTVK